MTINFSSVGLPATMKFAAATSTSPEQELAGLLSKAFIADAAALVKHSFSSQVPTVLDQLKATLLSGDSAMQISAAVVSDLGTLAEDGVKSPYDHAAGKALAGMITTARANALYALLPSNSITKSAFDHDIAKLKTGLKSGQGFAELFHIL